MTRRIVLGMLAVALIGVGAAPAAAAPSGEEPFTITCGEEPGDVHTFLVTMGPGLGEWTPAFVVDTNQRVIPYAISGTFEWLVEDPLTGEPRIKLVPVDAVKNAPKREPRYVDCSFQEGGFGGLIEVEDKELLVSFTLTPG